MERDFYRSSEELVVALQCSGAECGTLDLVGVQRQTLSFHSVATVPRNLLEMSQDRIEYHSLPSECQ